MTLRYLRHVLTIWENWRAHSLLRKVVPQLVALDARQIEKRRAHRCGSKAIDAERKQLMTSLLKAGVRHG